MMVTQVYQEENHKYQFDFSSALWASDTLHQKYKTVGNRFYDVDFLVETEDRILLIEYKNANVPDAAKPKALNPMEKGHLRKIAFKYHDSWIYLKAAGKDDKPLIYVYILEYPHGDSVTRKGVRDKLSEMLPVGLHTLSEIGPPKVKDVEVLSIDEWNRHKRYGFFPISSAAEK